jgi:hypothetical protein
VTTSAHALTSTNSATALSTAFIPTETTSLFARINFIFCLQMLALAVWIPQCLSNLYKACQLKFHTSFGLNDSFKILKCQALLNEAKSSKNAKPLLQKCESLLASITDKSSSQKLLLELAQYYAKNDPNRSYEMAQQLSSSRSLLHAAQSLQKVHPNFDSYKLTVLYARAFQALSSKSEIIDSLELAEAFYSVRNKLLTNQCIEKALRSVNDLSSAIVPIRIQLFCQIYKCYRKIEDQIGADSALTSAQNLLKEKTAPTNLIQARLHLADTFLSLQMFKEMDTEIDEIVKTFEEDISPSIENLSLLTQLIRKIGKVESSSIYKDFQVRPFIEKALQFLEKDSSTEQNAQSRVRVYVKIAELIKEKLSNDDDDGMLIAFSQKADVELLVKAEKGISKEIQALPETTAEDISFKGNVLIKFIRLDGADTAEVLNRLEALEKLYTQYSPRDAREKFNFGGSILSCYNEVIELDLLTNGQELKKRAEAFLKKHLSDIENEEKKETNIKIVWLLNAGDMSNCSPEQKKIFLEAAEALLPQLPPHQYEASLAEIIEKYLKVDRQKGVALLENYENRQAKTHFTQALTAGAAAIFTGTLVFYPRPFLALVNRVIQL